MQDAFVPEFTAGTNVGTKDLAYSRYQTSDYFYDNSEVEIDQSGEEFNCKIDEFYSTTLSQG